MEKSTAMPLTRSSVKIRTVAPLSQSDLVIG